ncbi:MAG: hypothetical protein LC104_10840, partial [Bacteroidales bacterium]|nr:hypothetical protein [Bacteroidales bacterium]
SGVMSEATRMAQASSVSGRYQITGTARPAQSLSASISTASTVRPSPFGPGRSPLSPSGQAEVATAHTTAHDPTPVDLGAVPVASPEMPPHTAKPERNPLLIPLIAAIAVAGLAILGLVGWILMGSSTK